MIETPRLLLRPHRVDDLDGYTALLAEAEPATLYALPSFNREDAWARLLRFIGHWAVFHYGLFIAEERASGRIVAEVGVARFERAVDSRCEGMPEAGWRVAQRMRGSGVAREAMTAAFAWFDGAIGAQSTFCLIHPHNAPSLRLADALQFRELSRGTFKGQPVITLVRTLA
jgi:RimJ/RimL family protein N-acetyltransferase